jgi:hypothetical protein
MDGKIEQKLADINCNQNEVRNQFTSYLNGYLASTEQLVIEDHLKRCKPCQCELKFLKLAMRAQEEDFASEAFTFLKSRS